jgi:Uma2 family endonuclease
MSTLLETATEVYIPRKVWTREEAHRLADLGFPNVDKLELVDGELIDHMGKKRPHVLWHNLVRQWLEKVFSGDYVQSEDPIDVAPEDNPRNEPEPDLIVTTKSIREFLETPKPDDLRLVVEISDTTLWFDLNIKAKLYARAGIVEYWVVNVSEKKLIVHREPQDGSYIRITTHASDEEITPLVADARFCLDKL